MLYLIAILSFVAAASAEDPGKIWAVLVSGSSGWGNYRHQADVYHAYQIAHCHGVPDEQIIMFHYDDIANNEQNPTKGKVINRPGGPDVYENVPKDYTGDKVTPAKFIEVLQGKKSGGKELKSGPNDHVFINLVDHGADGLFAFPSEILTVKQLIDALNYMHDNKRYGKLVVYLESCESGSMFRNVLKPDINIFATTASDWNEDSWACYCEDQPSCLGDCYSVGWMEDSDKVDIERETLDVQFEDTKKATTTSHVQKYGQFSLGSILVGEFLGRNTSGKIDHPPVDPSPIMSRDVPLVMLQKKIVKETDEDKRKQLMEQLSTMQNKRTAYTEWIHRMAAAIGGKSGPQLVSVRSELKNLDCHDTVAQFFHKTCVNLATNPFAMKYANLLVNVCEMGYEQNSVIKAMGDFCAENKIDGPVL